MIPILAEVRYFEWSAVSQLPEDPWERSGKGTVRIHESESHLQIEEKGEWTEAGRREAMHFTTTWHFSRMEEEGEIRILLGHGRRGKTHPLVLLKPVLSQCWESVQEHICGEDQYRAQLSIIEQPRSAHLNWWALGPRKNYHLHRIYYPDTIPSV